MEIFIEPDGEVVFADLPAELLPAVASLNPDAKPACDVDPAPAAGTKVPTSPDSD